MQNIGPEDKKARATPEVEDWQPCSKSLLHTDVPYLAEESQTAYNRKHWLSEKLCVGSNQSPSIINCSFFPREADSKSFPGVSGVSLRSCEALAGGCWEFSLFAHFETQ